MTSTGYLLFIGGQIFVVEICTWKLALHGIKAFLPNSRINKEKAVTLFWLKHCLLILRALYL